MIKINDDYFITLTYTHWLVHSPCKDRQPFTGHSGSVGYLVQNWILEAVCHSCGFKVPKDVRDKIKFMFPKD